MKYIKAYENTKPVFDYPRNMFKPRFWKISTKYDLNKVVDILGIPKDDYDWDFRKLNLNENPYVAIVYFPGRKKGWFWTTLYGFDYYEKTGKIKVYEKSQGTKYMGEIILTPEFISKWKKETDQLLQLPSDVNKYNL
jgi:hypothetical protein